MVTQSQAAQKMSSQFSQHVDFWPVSFQTAAGLYGGAMGR